MQISSTKTVNTYILQVLQASVMMLSVLLVAFYGVRRTGGIGEVWDRAVEGGRIFPPK